MKKMVMLLSLLFAPIFFFTGCFASPQNKHPFVEPYVMMVDDQIVKNDSNQFRFYFFTSSGAIFESIKVKISYRIAWEAEEASFIDATVTRENQIYTVKWGAFFLQKEEIWEYDEEANTFTKQGESNKKLVPISVAFLIEN